MRTICTLTGQPKNPSCHPSSSPFPCNDLPRYLSPSLSFSLSSSPLASCPSFAHFSIVPERPHPPQWDDSFVRPSYAPQSHTRNAFISYEPRSRTAVAPEVGFIGGASRAGRLRVMLRLLPDINLTYFISLVGGLSVLRHCVAAAPMLPTVDVYYSARFRVGNEAVCAFHCTFTCIFCHLCGFVGERGLSLYVVAKHTSK